MTRRYPIGVITEPYYSNIGTIDRPIMVAVPRFNNLTVDPDEFCAMIEQAMAMLEGLA